jgi:hypothetical protein
MKWTGLFELRCYNLGKLKWSEDIFNALTNEGEQEILDTYLRGAAGPSNFYIGLTGMADITKTTTLSTLTNEPVGNGYARQLVARANGAAGWTSLGLDNGDYLATSKIVSFEATNTWISVDKTFMSTSSDNSGKLISFASLSATRTLVVNDILDVTYKIKLQ